MTIRTKPHVVLDRAVPRSPTRSPWILHLGTCCETASITSFLLLDYARKSIARVWMRALTATLRRYRYLPPLLPHHVECIGDQPRGGAPSAQRRPPQSFQHPDDAFFSAMGLAQGVPPLVDPPASENRGDAFSEAMPSSCIGFNVFSSGRFSMLLGLTQRNFNSAPLQWLEPALSLLRSGGAAAVSQQELERSVARVQPPRWLPLLHYALHELADSVGISLVDVANELARTKLEPLRHEGVSLAGTGAYFGRSCAVLDHDVDGTPALHPLLHATFGSEQGLLHAMDGEVEVGAGGGETLRSLRERLVEIRSLFVVRGAVEAEAAVASVLEEVVESTVVGAVGVQDAYGYVRTCLLADISELS
eukprot:SAG11_NODE_2858_length_2900_cov_1.881471_2_plen_362_part_00